MNYICFAVSLRGVDATQRFKQVLNISDIKTEKKGETKMGFQIIY